MSKLEIAARQVVANGVQGTYAKYYSVPPADFEALRDALAEQAECPHGVDDGACKECYMEQAEQEPVAVVEITYGREPECYVTGNIDDFPEGVFKLYSAPVQTKDMTGQDLCDLEIAVGWKGDSHDFEVIVKAAIAKYKEKNRG